MKNRNVTISETYKLKGLGFVNDDIKILDNILIGERYVKGLSTKHEGIKYISAIKNLQSLLIELDYQF